MALTYKNLQAMYTTRRKGAEYKPLATDTRIYLVDGTFEIRYIHFQWTNKSVGKGYVRVERESELLATVTPDNVLTLEADTSRILSYPTGRNRIEKITGCLVWSDASGHRNKLSAIRIKGRYYDATTGSHNYQPWCTSTTSLPYVKGTKFQLNDDNNRMECLNKPDDVKLFVKNDAIQQAKASTAVIRKLVMAMSKLGEYDDMMNNKWGVHSTLLIAEINYASPTAEDAKAVFAHGLRTSTGSDRYRYVDGQGYVQIPEHERIQSYRMRCIENGMKALRKHIYQSSDGYERIVVNK